MQDAITKSPPRRHIARRVGAAGLVLAALVALGACTATGGGYIDAPVPTGVLPTGDIAGVYSGQADFGFNFTCEMTAKNTAVIKGEITYHDAGTSVIGANTFTPIRLHGVVDPLSSLRPIARRRTNCS